MGTKGRGRGGRPGTPARLAALAAAAALAAGALTPITTGGQPVADLPPWSGMAPPAPRADLAFPRAPEHAEILRLENGLQVILLRNPAQPMVGVYTQVRVGSAYEDFRTSGMSHMLEHLLFNGTREFTQEQLYDLADRSGAFNNANTADFYTNFMTVLPADKLETGLRLQSQMLFHSLIPADKFEKERGIVIGELVQSRDRDRDYAGETLRELLYQGSSLALPTLGTLSTIQNMKREDVVAFYRNHYVPNNMITMVAGGFDRGQALELLRRYYGEAPPGAVRRPDVIPAIFLDRTQALARRGGDRHALLLAYDAPGYGSPDFLPFVALTRMLAAPGDGILTRALARIDAARRPEVSSWWEKADGFGRLVIRFDLKPGDEPAPYHRLVQEACLGALEWGITDEDVLKVVRLEETSTLIDREQLRQLSITGAEMIVLGGPDLFLNYLSRLRQVAAQDVAQVINAYLVDAVCLALHVTPAAAGRSGSGATDQPPADAPVVKRTKLANGAVVITQQNPGAALFAGHVAVRNRALLDGATPGALNLVHRLLTSGVGGCDAACLQGRLGRLGAVLKLVDDPRIPMDNYYTSGRFSFIRLEAAAEHGPEALELVAEMMGNASFTAADFARERELQIAQLARQQGSAGALANRRLEEALFGAHPLGRPAEGDAASLRALTFEQARALYRRAFAPPNLIVSVASPYAHEEIVELVNELLPAGRAEPAGGLPPLPVTAESSRVIATLGGQMAAIRVGSLLKVEAADRRPLEVLVAILSNRLAMDLREKQGLSYSVGASYDGFGDGQVLFQAWLNPPRDRLEEGQQALLRALAEFDAATVTTDELVKTRSALAGRLMMRRLASISQAYYLAMHELDGNLPGYHRMLTAFDTVTLTDLRRAGEKYLRSLQLVTVVVE